VLTKYGQKLALDLAAAGRAQDLGAGQIGHIKDIDDALAIGRDMG